MTRATDGLMDAGHESAFDVTIIAASFVSSEGNGSVH